MRGAVSGVIREAVIAAALTAVDDSAVSGQLAITMIIAISIPLSILTSVIVLGLLGETINTMTLGGLALAVGILVDDATVTIENIERFLEQGQPCATRFLKARRRSRCRRWFRRFASALCFCRCSSWRRGALSVCASGRGGCLCDARLLHPLANAGADAGDVSAAAHKDAWTRRRKSLRGFSADLNAVSNGCGAATTLLLERLVVRAQGLCAGLSGGRVSASFLLLPWLGQDFFPDTDSGQFILHVRGNAGHAYRRDGAALRPGGAEHPAADSRYRRWTISSTTSACPTAR